MTTTLAAILSLLSLGAAVDNESVVLVPFSGQMGRSRASIEETGDVGLAKILRLFDGKDDCIGRDPIRFIGTDQITPDAGSFIQDRCEWATDDNARVFTEARRASGGLVRPGSPEVAKFHAPNGAAGVSEDGVTLDHTNPKAGAYANGKLTELKKAQGEDLPAEQEAGAYLEGGRPYLLYGPLERGWENQLLTDGVPAVRWVLNGGMEQLRDELEKRDMRLFLQVSTVGFWSRPVIGMLAGHYGIFNAMGLADVRQFQ